MTNWNEKLTDEAIAKWEEKKQQARTRAAKENQNYLTDAPQAKKVAPQVYRSGLAQGCK